MKNTQENNQINLDSPLTDAELDYLDLIGKPPHIADDFGFIEDEILAEKIKKELDNLGF